ncbi:ABC transporter ATP-binding protein [Streptomyces sp. NPDC090052]|uniref:ABC transporter ATP-binding protein n=1 Tax=Streptomyces sp. NPDC090052 TaxID=3365931 RepID=UPI003824B68C
MRDVHYRIGNRKILDSVDLRVSPGESIAVSGPSGSGKSTLLMCILGLIKPSSGSISVCGERIETLTARNVLRHRRQNIGVVFQSGELLPELSPLENVAIAAMFSKTPRNEAFASARQLLNELNVAPEASDTGSLSGGERQRVAVARALINKPSLLLADEPTGALDAAARHTVADLLYELPERWQCGLVLVTHDSMVASRAQRQFWLYDGLLSSRQSAEVDAIK